MIKARNQPPTRSHQGGGSAQHAAWIGNVGQDLDRQHKVERVTANRRGVIADI